MKTETSQRVYTWIRTPFAGPARRRWPGYMLSVGALGTMVWLGTPCGGAAPGAVGSDRVGLPRAEGMRHETERGREVRTPLDGASWVRAGNGGAPAELEVGTLQARAQRAGFLWARVEAYYEREIAPIARVLVRYRDDPALARRVAVALVREARRTDLEPRLLLSVLLVENPWLDPTARSPVGAVGLMQVMPFHRGNWPPCEPDLEGIESNICHGARIFAHSFHLEGGDLEQALLRYNGCVNGTNTPDCHRYPFKVFALAGRASLQGWLRPLSP